MTLNGKRLVVLGGSSGIGLAVAQAAAREGSSLVIVSSNRARIDAALKSLPDGAQGHAVDLSSEAAIQAMFAELTRRALSFLCPPMTGRMVPKAGTQATG